MPIRLTRPGKHTILINNPVMPMAGRLASATSTPVLDLNAFGALVTNPVTTAPRQPPTARASYR